MSPILDDLDKALTKLSKQISKLKPIDKVKLGSEGVSKFGDSLFRCQVRKDPCE